MKYSHIFLMVFFVMSLPVKPSHASLEAYPEERPAPARKTADIPGAAANREERYTELGWEKLIPANWNPVGAFDGLNLDMMEDNDPRADEAMKKIRKMWDEAPINPDLQGKTIEISGFVASLDFTGKAELKEFLLVPYFGACIHVPPPPANQIIHVTLDKPRKGIRALDEVTVYGTLAIEKRETDLGRSGYDLQADAVEPYVEKKK